MGSEARLLGSILEVQVGEWVEASREGLDQLGPLEVALEAWKLSVLQLVGAGREEALQQ